MTLPDRSELLAYTPAPDLLKDRVILITGAGDGIGRALAKSSAAHGATVILLSRTLPKLEHVYDEIEDAGGPQPAMYPMNLEGASARDYDDLAATLEREFGRLDALVHNAGMVTGLTPLRHYDMERWMQVMQVNLNAPFFLTRVCLPLLEQAPDPCVLFSTHDCTRAFWGAYGAAKHGLLGLMKILAHEYSGDRPMRVNGVDTGPVRTRLHLQNYPGTRAGEIPEAQDVVAPYLYFLGPDSRGVTGENVELQPREVD